jgi:hypothetical protein
VNKAQIKAAEVLANQRMAFEKKVRSLLGHVAVIGSRENRVKAADLDRVFNALQYKGEYGPAAEALAAEIASREPVGAAVHAQKAEAVKHAEKGARDHALKLLAELAAQGGNLNAYAPYPRSRGWSRSAADEAAINKHNLVLRLTKPNESVGYQSYSTDPNRPYFRVMDEEAVEKFVADAMGDAALQYDMFICKMVAKIGPAQSAELSGSHVWGYSFLDVVKPDGSRERWKTQQIVNYSKYGRPYYQWPSRKVK